MGGQVIDRELTCTRCERDYQYVSQPCSLELCSSCYELKRRAARKRRCVEYLGGACARCGYDRCVQALQFHHLRDKIMKLNTMIKNGAGWARLKAELDKCELLCANCHAEHHAGFIGEI